jgi:hypothetical protein
MKNMNNMQDEYPQAPPEYEPDTFSRAHHSSLDKDKPNAKKRYGLGGRIVRLVQRTAKVLFCLLLLFGLAYAISGTGNLAGQIGIASGDFPSQLNSPKTVDFHWSYKGKAYFLEETLYGNVDAYYKDNPTKAFTDDVSIDEYYTNLTLHLQDKKDDTASRVVRDIEAEGLKNNLSPDEMLELVISFVQSIPYDGAKYAAMTSSPDHVEASWPRFPYEVLYDDTGICTDKSLLTVALVDELHYGTALFSFDKEEHMVPAIECTSQYSSYASGYCFTEVTNTGFKIGDSSIDELDSGRALTKAAIHHADSGMPATVGALPFQDFHVYGKKDGKTYAGIVETVTTMDRIGTLKADIDARGAELESAKKAYQDLEVSVNADKQEADAAYSQHLAARDASSYRRYTQKFDQYNAAYGEYEKKIKLYNSQVDEYNNMIDEYNSLINSFYDVSVPK